MALLWELTDVEVTSAKFERRRDRVLLVGEAGAGQVEMHPVRTDLLGFV